MKKKLVTLGAGTGQANLLSALAKYSDRLDITAIVGVSDNGGHSGLLRSEFNIPQVGDSRQCLIALSPPSQLRDDYNYRDDLGNSRGNDRLAAATLEYGKLSLSLEQAAKELGTKGRVLPVTDEVVDIAAVLTDDTRVVGEWQIIDRQPRTSIKGLYLEPSVEACHSSIQAVQEADFLVISPGSLRTGIVACLLAGGMSEAIQDTRAAIIMVVNLMTHPGQTDGFTVQDHLDEFVRYAGRRPHFAIINQGSIPQHLLEHYARIGSEPVGGEITVPRTKPIYGDFIPRDNNFRVRQERVGDFKKWTHALVHDGTKLARAVTSIIHP